MFSIQVLTSWILQDLYLLGAYMLLLKFSKHVCGCHCSNCSSVSLEKISFFRVGFPFFLFANKLSDFEALYPHYQVSLSSLHVDLNPKSREVLSICECN
jgi:hypothetical protein